MEVFLGISAASGAGIGPAFLVPESVKRSIPRNIVKASDMEAGWTRFEKAVQIVTADVSDRLASLPSGEKSNDVQREILETYILMLADPVFLKELKDYYEKELFNIEYVVHKKSQEYADRLRNAGNDYLAERAQDITDIFGRVLNEMLGIHPFDINKIPDESIVIATTLSPTDAIVLSRKKIAGLALTEGGLSSHVVILARNYGIPTIVGVNRSSLQKKIKNGELLVIDGEIGEILADPDESTLVEYNEKINSEKEQQALLDKYLTLPAETKDGTKFKLYANIGSTEEAEIAAKSGADGIGLFRTEFLYMSMADGTPHVSARSFNEEEQFDAYKKVLETMNGKPVTIRTLDAGGDKLINSVDIPNFEEKNPLMGMRAVRLSLTFPQILKTQFRALYRASVYGDLRIMIPLITSSEQVQECLKIAAQVREELKSEGIPFNKKVPIGIMVETAAAALTSDCLAKLVDFFSLGTNDLTQYTLAVDRENSNVSGIYDEFNLAVLRLIDITIQNAKKYRIPLSVCGEMAGRQESVLVLAGMGIRNLSMGAKMIPRTKELLHRFTIKELKAISSKKLNKL
ncbi:MAG: phosphoenolpyruvate--protein phosphotransferase [Treponema sp.]|nr:phosphoenolpyruvate--protein phosphotransferase [Treponema sp.]